MENLELECQSSSNNMGVQLTSITQESNVSIHNLCFSLLSDNFTDEYVNNLAIEFFNIELSKFYPVDKKQNCYKKRYVYNNMFKVNVQGYADNKNSIYLEITGKGCEALGNAKLLEIIQNVHLCDGNITRLDLAIDDYDGILNFKKISECCNDFKNRVITSFKRAPQHTHRTDGTGESFIFGEPSSDTRLTVYNRGLYYDFDYSCIRVELQMKDKKKIKAFFETLIDGFEMKPIQDFYERSRRYN